MAGSHMLILLVTSLLTVDDIIASKLSSHLLTKKIEQPTIDNMDNVHRNLAGQHRFDEQKQAKKGDLREDQNHAELRRRIMLWPVEAYDTIESFGILIGSFITGIQIVQEKSSKHPKWQFDNNRKWFFTLSRDKKVSQLKDSLERLKKSRAKGEKVKRNTEQDLKSTQEAVEDKQRVKRDQGESMRKKDNDQKSTRLLDEQSLVADLQRKIKEIQARIELEKEVEVEQLAHAEQTVRHYLDELTLQSESQIATLGKTLPDATNEKVDQIDQLEKAEQKVEKEKKSGLRREINDLQSQIEHVSKNRIVEMCNILMSLLKELSVLLKGVFRAAGDKVKRAMGDAGRLNDELRTEQRQSQQFEVMRKNLESLLRELFVHLHEVESQAHKMRELEGDPDREPRRLANPMKNMHKADRRLKAIQADEYRKNKLQDIVDCLQTKIETLLEEAFYVSKFRKVQTELEDAEERTELNVAENPVQKLSARNRRSLSQTRTTSGGLTTIREPYAA